LWEFFAKLISLEAREARKYDLAPQEKEKENEGEREKESEGPPIMLK